MPKILFITTRLPYPANEGHQIRTYNLLKRICLQHEVHYLSLQRIDDDKNAVSHLQSICKSVATFDIPSEHSRIRFFKDLLLGFITKAPYVVQKYFSIELKNGNVVGTFMLPKGVVVPGEVWSAVTGLLIWGLQYWHGPRV